MTSSKTETLSVLDRPNSYIGKTVPRPNLDRLLQGRAQYVSDMELPRMAHVVFVRSPHAHARIVSLDAAAARRMPGVVAVVTGQELAGVITPWVGVLSHLKGLKSAPQSAIAIDRVCWQGEAVAAVLAISRAAAEDAAEHVAVTWQELPVVTDMGTALDRDTPVIHASLGDNLAWERFHDAGAVDQAVHPIRSDEAEPGAQRERIDEGAAAALLVLGAAREQQRQVGRAVELQHVMRSEIALQAGRDDRAGGVQVDAPFLRDVASIHCVWIASAWSFVSFRSDFNTA